VRKKTAQASLGIVLFLIFCALAGELLLRVTHSFESYCEATHRRGCVSDSGFMSSPWLYIYRPNSTALFESSEFNGIRKTNAEGLVGPLFNVQKAPGEFRIIILGDSFTAGMGANEGHGPVENLLALMQRQAPTGTQFKMLNAGVPASDPVFYRELLKRRLLRYRPDLVLMMVNSTDIDDISRRGGRERFDPDGKIRDRSPWFSVFFQHARIVRAFVIGLLHYNWDLLSPSEISNSQHASAKVIAEISDEIAGMSKQENFQFAVIIHPFPQELAEGHYWRTDLISPRLKENKIPVFDLFSDLNKRIKRTNVIKYYWPIDGHFNQSGYEEMAKSIFSYLRANGMVPLQRGPQNLRDEVFHPLYPSGGGFHADRDVER
jgi:lysophospholipase L1-like esterase